MPTNASGVAFVVALVYAAYFLGAVLVLKSVWRRTASIEGRRRTVLRSLAFSVLFAPALAGMRVAPFLLAVLASVVLDLLFVRPLSLAWAEKSALMFAQYMLLPFLVTWAVILVGAFVVQWAGKKQ